MADLIERMDAVQATRVGPSDEWSRDTKGGYELAATDCMMNILKIPPSPEVLRLRARIAALEALVAAGDGLAKAADDVVNDRRLTDAEFDEFLADTSAALTTYRAAKEAANG